VQIRSFYGKQSELIQSLAVLLRHGQEII